MTPASTGRAFGAGRGGRSSRTSASYPSLQGPALRCRIRSGGNFTAHIAATDAQNAAPPREAAALHAPVARAAAYELQDGEGGEFHTFFQQQWGTRWRALFAALAAPTQHVALHNSFLLRQPAAGDLAGASPLVTRHSALAAALQAAAATAGRVDGGIASGCSSSDAPAVQALHWERPQPDDTAAGTGYPPPPVDAASGLSTHYWLDPASLLPPLLLGVRPGQQVLDMCAAPGGKSLVLAHLLFAAQHAAEAAAAGCGNAGEDSDGDGSGGSWGGRARSRAAGGRAEAGGGYSGQLVCNELDPGRRGRLLRVLKAYVPADVRQHMRWV